MVQRKASIPRAPLDMIGGHYGSTHMGELGQKLKVVFVYAATQSSCSADRGNVVAKREPKLLSRGRDFHRTVQADWLKNAQGKLWVEKALTKPIGRRGRIDVFIADASDATSCANHGKSGSTSTRSWRRATKSVPVSSSRNGQHLDTGCNLSRPCSKNEESQWSGRMNRLLTAVPGQDSHQHNHDDLSNCPLEGTRFARRSV
jgi:hypothetical protein